MSDKQSSLKKSSQKNEGTLANEKSSILQNASGNDSSKENTKNGVMKKTKIARLQGSVQKKIASSKENQAEPIGDSEESAGSIVTIIEPVSSSSNSDMSNLVQTDDGMNGNVPKSSKIHASFNYINSILGSGVIGMPYALHRAGVGLGLILMVLVAFMTDYSLVLMIRGSSLAGSSTYQGVMESAFGRPGYWILTLVQFIYPLIAMISYNIIVGDTLTKLLGYLWAPVRINRAGVVLAATIFITFPLSLYRNVAKLSKVSFFSLLSIAFILVAIFVRLDTNPQPWTEDSWKFGNGGGLIQAIGVYAFAFMCHHNTFILYNSLKDPTVENWSKVTHISIGTSLVVSILFSLGGYGTFTGSVQGDLLENYCPDDDLINIARLLFCITILLTFPLECFVVRDVIENLCFSSRLNYDCNVNGDSSSPAVPASSTSRHFMITLGIVLLSYSISMSTDCLGVVLELNGVLAAIPLAYVLPALCYLKLEKGYPMLSTVKLPALGIALFGIIASLSGIFILIINGSSSNCSHGEIPSYCHQILRGTSNNLTRTVINEFQTTTMSPSVEMLPQMLNP